jgi:hypothetical protein
MRRDGGGSQEKRLRSAPPPTATRQPRCALPRTLSPPAVMSAYGALSSKTSSIPPLASTVWPVTSRAGGGASHVTIHHLTLARAAALPGLLDTLHAAFAAIIEEGMTYPQEILQGEAYTRDAFDAYFMAADVIVAVAGHGNAPASVSDSAAVVEVQSGIDEARDGRSWDECVAGFYYVRARVFLWYSRR